MPIGREEWSAGTVGARHRRRGHLCEPPHVELGLAIFFRDKRKHGPVWRENGVGPAAGHKRGIGAQFGAQAYRRGRRRGYPPRRPQHECEDTKRDRDGPRQRVLPERPRTWDRGCTGFLARAEQLLQVHARLANVTQSRL